MHSLGPIGEQEEDTHRRKSDHHHNETSPRSYTYLPPALHRLMTDVRADLYARLSLHALRTIRLSLRSQTSQSQSQTSPRLQSDRRNSRSQRPSKELSGASNGPASVTLDISQETVDLVLAELDSLPHYMHHSSILQLNFLEPIKGMQLFMQQLTEPDSQTLRLQSIGTIYILLPETSSTNGASDYVLPYWLILIPSGGEQTTSELRSAVQQSGILPQVMIRFQCEGLTEEEQKAILADVESGLRAICKRVNQLLLLWSLHKTSHCSALLEAEGQGQTQQQTKSPWQDSFVLHVGRERVNPYFLEPEHFRPGRFACLQQHQIRIPLHKRLVPEAAIRAVIGMFLPSYCS